VSKIFQKQKKQRGKAERDGSVYKIEENFELAIAREAVHGFVAGMIPRLGSKYTHAIIFKRAPIREAPTKS